MSRNGYLLLAIPTVFVVWFVVTLGLSFVFTNYIIWSIILGIILSLIVAANYFKYEEGLVGSDEPENIDSEFTEPKTPKSQYVLLPANFVWDVDHQQLYCADCYPSHTIPLWGIYGQPTEEFLEDENIKSFISSHQHIEEQNYENDKSESLG